MAKQKDWAKELSSKCGVDEKTLQFALEELSESCYGDATTSKRIIEELTMSCGMSKTDVEEFIKQVSKSCPMDAKKLEKEVTKAEGDKDEAFKAINLTAGRFVPDRSGVR